MLDRFIQQCLLQVLQPQFDPTFSEHSYGFRPGRSAHDAVRSAQKYIQSGRRWVADVDLAKFFDRVNHDVLIERLSRRIADGRVLGLIRRYLVAVIRGGAGGVPRSRDGSRLRAAVAGGAAGRTAKGDGSPATGGSGGMEGAGGSSAADAIPLDLGCQCSTPSAMEGLVMKNLPWALVALFAFATPAFGQSSGADGQDFGSTTYYRDVDGVSTLTALPPRTPQAPVVAGLAPDTLLKIFRINSDGSITVKEVSPLTAGWRLVGGAAIISDTCAQHMADSSAVYYVGDLKNLVLWVLVQGGGRTTRSAISVREHLGSLSDTLSVFRTQLRPSAGTLGQAAWGADTLGFGGSVQPLNQAQGSGEFVLHTAESALAAARWADASGGRAWKIPLVHLWGAENWTPYISVRVRNLMSDVPARYIVYLTGTPL